MNKVKYFFRSDFMSLLNLVFAYYTHIDMLFSIFKHAHIYLNNNYLHLNLIALARLSRHRINYNFFSAKTSPAYLYRLYNLSVI